MQGIPSFNKTTPISEGLDPHPRLDTRLRRFLAFAIFLLTGGYTFLDYWAYSRLEHTDPLSWQRLAAGQGIAPAQYRIGIYYSANFFAHITHLQFRHIFALSDFVCTGGSLAVLFFLLVRQPRFREAEPHSQWGQLCLGLFLVQVYLSWTLWFQEPETLPSCAILSATCLCCSGFVRVPRAMLVITILLVALLGSTIRVDSVIALHAGLLFASLVAAPRSVPLGRWWQAGTSLAALLIALATEQILAHAVFPHARREVALFQLAANLRSINGAIAILCTLIPAALTVWLGFRHWRLLNAWARGLLIGACLHFVMFLLFGMSEEVRIFLPFALVLLPLSVPWLWNWFQGQSSPETVTF